MNSKEVKENQAKLKNLIKEQKEVVDTIQVPPEQEKAFQDIEVMVEKEEVKKIVEEIKSVAEDAYTDDEQSTQIDLIEDVVKS